MFAAQRIKALGALSAPDGTGIDAAVIDTDGDQIFDLGDFGHRAFDEAERDRLSAAVGAGSEAIEEAAEIIETACADVLSEFDDFGVIGFGGFDPAQTGAPLGDGAVLAEVLGATVVWDFHSSDIQLGGTGQPLTPFYHFALARYLGSEGPVVFADLGEVARLTWVDPAIPRPQDDGALWAIEAGPCMGALRHLAEARGMDVTALADTAEADGAVIDGFLNDPYFFRMAPKLMPPALEGRLRDAIVPLDDGAAAATVMTAAALCVVTGIEQCPRPPVRVIVTGAGRTNATLMTMLSATLDMPVQQAEDHGINGDAIAAQAMGYLAVRVMRGLPTSCPATTGVRAAVSGGTVSRPVVGHSR